MGRKILAALLAAASIMPAAAVAQDRGGPRMERGQGRPSGGFGAPQRQARQGGGWQQRGERPQSFAPRAQRPGGFEQRQPRAQNEAPIPRFQGQRPEGPRGDSGPRGFDRPQSGPGAVTPTQPRLPRERVDTPLGARPDGWNRGPDGRSGARPDRQPDRRFDAQRGWDRSGADRNDQRRWDRDRRDRVDANRWYGGRDERRGWNSDWLYNDGRGWNRDWRRDTRYDWNRWRATNRNAFRLPRYYAPSGWDYGYRQFGIGAVLSSVLFAQNYWINDPWAYRLPEADGPYRWVRYYNDALLVDVYSGEVVDVINDIFW
ncbi:RcnB family protein [uncultured Sphingomonas sp.]|uniref:RcnB family protein n=1 Tax=uncultured Sphingomonas sp. TaxID=158754 RepID=UPI0025DD55BB|nr:RcnB family protein [uncultured Sphingomonas sp.]